MAATQNLKKKLKSIQATQKLTRAMKNAAAAKFSQLNGIYRSYAVFAGAFDELRREYGPELHAFFARQAPEAPVGVVVLSSNRGMCGGFNAELLSFAGEYLRSLDRPFRLAVCGAQGILYCAEEGLKPEKTFLFSDVPTYTETDVLFSYVMEEVREQRVSEVKIIYPEYINMMTHTPVVTDLFGEDETPEARRHRQNALWVPDRETVLLQIASRWFCSILYEKALKTALGAQAATLLSMRSAYDTAAEYCNTLTAEINRRRQGAVTADVLETSGEREKKEG